MRDSININKYKNTYEINIKDEGKIKCKHIYNHYMEDKDEIQKYK